jgi:hypothetical protein
MDSWFQSVWPVVVFVLGGASKYLADALQVRRQDRREELAKKDKLAGRREEFELKTLSDLQVALKDLLVAVATARRVGLKAVETGQAVSTHWTDHLGGTSHRVNMLKGLVLDGRIRALVVEAQRLLLAIPDALPEDSPPTNRAFLAGVTAYETAQESLSERIREIYLTSGQQQ